MILALIVLFIAARGFLPERLTNPLRRPAGDADETLPAAGPPPVDPPGQPGRTGTRSTGRTGAGEA